MEEIKLKSNFNDEELKEFESKVDNVMKILQNLKNSNKDEKSDDLKTAESFIGSDSHLADIDDENFIVKVKEDRTIINHSVDSEVPPNVPDETDKFTFMQQLETDANKRIDNKHKREEIAQNLRKLGNEAFRLKQFEKAINMYTKAIDHIKDSPILYNNRALSYMRMCLYKRAIIDCDFVLNKLDEKNLRAWLYRAAAYYALDDMNNFEKSIKIAKKNNSKELDYIEKFVQNIRDGSFMSSK